MAKRLNALIYSNGRTYEGADGFMFEGPSPKRIVMERGMSLEDLKNKINMRLKLSEHQYISTLRFRFLNGMKYMSMELSEDDDIEFMVDCFDQNPALNAMEVFVEIESVMPNSTAEAGPSNSPNLCYPRRFSQDIQTFQSAPLLFTQNSSIQDEVPSHVDNILMREYNSASSEDEDFVPDEDDFISESEDEFDYASSVPPTPSLVRPPSPPITAMPENFCMPEANLFQPPCPQFSEINWDAFNDDETSNYVEEDQFDGSQELHVGLIFPTKEAVKLALEHYSIRRHQDYKVLKSDHSRLTARCPRFGTSCNWSFRAILGKKSNVWKITQYNGPHTCVNSSLTQDHKKLRSGLVKGYILGMVKAKPNVEVCLIVEAIQREFGYQLSYRKAWLAKQRATAEIFGDWDSSYAMLERWLEAMKLYMPGTVTVLHTDDYVVHNRVVRGQKMFVRLFWTFKPCIDGFKHCKPMIQIDATHLYGKYRHKLLIATTQDGNRNPLSIAFAIVDEETKDNWSWFLACIRLYVTQQEGLCLISDRHKGILTAVADSNGWQPPYATHVYCLRHVVSNFNNKFHSGPMKKLLKSTGYEACIPKFNEKMQKLAENPEMANWINAIPKEKWSLAHDGGVRFGHMTTNLAESVNGVLKGARLLPITAIVQMTYFKLVEYFTKRRANAQRRLTVERQAYTSDLIKMWEYNSTKATSHQVRLIDQRTLKFAVQQSFSVQTQSDGMVFALCLSQRWCDCGRFQALHFPCSHALAACNVMSMDAFQYVHDVYKTATVCQVYEGQWEPIKDEAWWPAAPPVQLVPDPRLRRQKGRPRSSRITNEMDWQEQGPPQQCSRCHQIGHNRRSCPSRLNQDEGPSHS